MSEDDANAPAGIGGAAGAKPTTSSAKGGATSNLGGMGNLIAGGASETAGEGGAPASVGTPTNAGAPASAGTSGSGPVAVASAGSAGRNGDAVVGGSAGAPNGSAGVGNLPTYTISGTVAGLVGNGLQLSVGSGAPLVVSTDGGFAFPAQLPSGSNAKVTVIVQPTLPQQTCTVSATGSIASLTRDITDVTVICATNHYAIGGTITGLKGRGLAIQNDAGDELTMGGNGRFAFPTKVQSGKPYTVTVKTQPTLPDQTCFVTGGSGTVGSSDVTSVAINCATNSFTIGGTVAGLAGSGLVLRNNAGEELMLSANGSFAFASPVLSGEAFAVNVVAQPALPTQSCVVLNGTGTVANGNVASVTVQCTTLTYVIGGTVTGLLGTGLTLQNNLTDNLAISVDGSFHFTTAAVSGSPYGITVQSQPTGPTQTCTVANGTGNVSTLDVTTVAINCVTKQYSVGGAVIGLTSAGLVLRNGTDEIAIGQEGVFTFPATVASGKTFGVTVKTQPNGQRCNVVSGQGTVGSANISSIVVNCSDKAFMIGGSVTGLTGSGLQLTLNGQAPLDIGSAGDFAFPDLLATNADYQVGIVQQPTNPWQNCTLTNAAGTVAGSDVLDLAVVCTTSSYKVGGSVTGLRGTGLVLRNNGGDELAVTADGTFEFPVALASGTPYAVSVKTHPTVPSQDCVVTNAGGSIGGASISNVQVTCTTKTYSISGSVSGLAGSLVLSNGTDTLSLNANGTFGFNEKVESGANYEVKVTTQPSSPLQVCTVNNGQGAVVASDITNISVECVTSKFTVGGTLTGLANGQQLVIRNNAADTLTLDADGPFTFANSLASGSTYEVKITSSPASQLCSVSGGTGSVGSANVTSVTINCTVLRTLGGTVAGLTGTGLVLKNGTDTVAISGAGTFAFNKLYADGASYGVTVQTQPSSPWQTCSVTRGTGTFSSDVNDVEVTCASNPYKVSVNVSGLSGTGLVLQNNNSDNLAVSTAGTWTFAASVLSGQSYGVAVLTQPSSPKQTCTVTSSTGTIANSDVTLNVTCASNNYTIGGTVSGYVGTGLVLKNNSGNDLNISSTGVFTFTNTVASGTSYSVTIGKQPNGFTCAVTNGKGTVANANVTSVRVSCPCYAFDTGTQGWTIAHPPTGIAQPTWSSTQGYPDAGALMVVLGFNSSNCQQLDLNVPPPTTLGTSVTKLTAWLRFDAFPNASGSGSVQLYAQDSNWGWNGIPVNLSTFQLGVWKQVSLSLTSGGGWLSPKAMGIQINPGGSSCQSATMYVDSVQFE